MSKIQLIPDHDNPNRFAVLRQEAREAPMDPVVPDPTIYSITTGTHEDQAKSFFIKTITISAVAGITTFTISIVLAGVPALSLAAFMYGLGGIALVWILAFLMDNIFSAAGIQLFNSHRFWQYMQRDQKHNHEMARRPDQWIDRP